MNLLATHKQNRKKKAQQKQTANPSSTMLIQTQNLPQLYSIRNNNRRNDKNLSIRRQTDTEILFFPSIQAKVHTTVDVVCETRYSLE